MMSQPVKHAVTGASGYTGKYITRLLLDRGINVVSLTGHPERPHEFGDRIQTISFNFEKPQLLAESLQGVHTLYNTYWVRFDYAQNTYRQAVENTKILFAAARQAGVQRLVHVSISNPSLDSPLPYFQGKAELEKTLIDSGLSSAIIRPTVIFGKEDILINNIAYLLRQFPIFAIPGSGQYRLQPIYVEDMARLCFQAGQEKENLLIDAAGTEIFTFSELVRLIRQSVRSQALLIHLAPTVAFWLSRVVGMLVRDVVLTKEEVLGLMDDLLVSNQPPDGTVKLSDWLFENRDWVGSRYASELNRHYRK